jgi:SpoVK/Ycf46/Vps4 family AAA+-type ATPase
MEDWPFDRQSARGQGLVALFCGPSGTGKTMAAEAIAHELGMRLYRVDLAGVVSKYIGETEKNLKTVLDEAERAHAVIFFDEADALFGKRSEVKDAHDRYANIEINYLLQRIESYSGVALLATNLRHHLDEAFLRRIHLTVEFAAPKVPQRRVLWSRAFAGAPVDELDLDFIAARFEVNGGTIRNAALGAAYLAADADAPIGMRQVLAALRQELVKGGRRAPAADFGRYADLLPID